MTVLTHQKPIGTALQTSLYRSYPPLPTMPVHLLDQDTATIGRSSQCKIFLHDQAASRVHAEINPDQDGHILVDYKSTNGTFVNGIRVDECRLNHGDVISLGNSVFRVIEHDCDQDLERQISYLQATRDPITNTHTLAYFLEQFYRELVNVRRKSQNLTLMACSPIHDKSTQLPVQITQEFATRFANVLRADTCITRLSDPDRLILLVPDCNEHGARSATDRLTEVTESKQFGLFSGESQSISLSTIACTTPLPSDMSPEAIVGLLISLSNKTDQVKPGFQSIPMAELTQSPLQDTEMRHQSIHEKAMDTWLLTPLESETKLEQ